MFRFQTTDITEIAASEVLQRALYKERCWSSCFHKRSGARDWQRVLQ